MTADNEEARAEALEEEHGQPETLDAPGESFGGALLRVALWAIVFLEILIIYGVRK